MGPRCGMRCKVFLTQTSLESRSSAILMAEWAGPGMCNLVPFFLKDPDSCNKVIASLVVFEADSTHVKEVAGNNCCGRVDLGWIMDDAADNLGAPHFTTRPEDSIDDRISNFPKFLLCR